MTTTASDHEKRMAELSLPQHGTTDALRAYASTLFAELEAARTEAARDAALIDGINEDREQLRAKLRRAERVVEACIDWQNDDGSCHFCGFGVSLGPPMRDIPHDNECPLVENGFITKDGARAGREEKAGG